MTRAMSAYRSADRDISPKPFQPVVRRVDPLMVSGVTGRPLLAEPQPSKPFMGDRSVAPATGVAPQGLAFPPPIVREEALAAPEAVDIAPPKVRLDSALWAEVNRVNREVNRRIRQTSDERNFGVEDFWQLPAGANARGDCEDYVLAKRQALIERGVPSGALSIAIAKTRWGETHAVLLLASETGEYVLDSLSPWVSRWDRIDYDWQERQAPGKVFEWVRL